MFLAQRCNGNRLPFCDSPDSGQAGGSLFYGGCYAPALEQQLPPTACDTVSPAANSLAGGVVFTVAD
jgi:hypothetical protein